jgi:SnoaL-like domain
MTKESVAPKRMTTVVGVTNMLERLRDASNAHDPRRLASLFAEDYQSSQPLHPGRDFVGRARVLQNWLSVFEGVPDFSSELVASAVNGETRKLRPWNGVRVLR